MLLEGVALNPEPLIVTEVPTGPLVGVKLVMVGCARTEAQENNAMMLSKNIPFISLMFCISRLKSLY
jgi:hypothetical protein